MLQNSEGKRVPQVSFRTREGARWVDVTTDEIFGGKTVVVFSLPGAFTPTCSSAHVPRYNELADVFRANGVDEIICLAVNDAFVMNAWQREQAADKLRFLPDGNGDFSKGMGLLVDKRGLGFGDRAWRYSMLVRDGVIDKMFIEPEVDGDPFEVSDADTMLKHINPEALAPPDVFMLTRPTCSHCARAKTLLAEHGLPYAETIATPRMLRAVSDTPTTPRVFVDGKLIGGTDELAAFLEERRSRLNRAS